MNALSSMSIWALVVLALVIAVVLAVALVTGLHYRSTPDRRERRGLTAAAYMTAVGSLFAILTGFLINSAYVNLQDTQNAVGSEVAAATQLAYASGALPPPDADRVQAWLQVYLNSLVNGEWQALAQNAPQNSPAVGTLRDLQQTIYPLTARAYVPSTIADAMVNATQQMATARSDWISLASEDLPFPLFALAVLSGIALIVNALVVSGRSGRRYAVIAAGIIIVVVLDVTAIIGISAPFRGAFIVDSHPISQVTQELQNGEYLPWVKL